MSTIVRMPDGINPQPCEFLLRISEAISACREPQEFARIIAAQFGEVLLFNHLALIVLKKIPRRSNVCPPRARCLSREVPVEELSIWHVYNTQDPLYIANWNSDQRLVSRSWDRYPATPFAAGRGRTWPVNDNLSFLPFIVRQLPRSPFRDCDSTCPIMRLIRS
jgi:hypothetical protein